jgi:hypothetical protein
LTSSQFARANAELDRENAHFSISEAIISAMEQIRCRRDVKLADDQFDDSDPEIMDLKQRIRIRRREKLVEKQRKVWTEPLMSDGKTDSEYLNLFCRKKSLGCRNKEKNFLGLLGAGSRMDELIKSEL